MPSVTLNRDELARAFEAERLYGARYAAPECRHFGVAFVSCSYRMDTRLGRIQGFAPFESSFEIGFRDGRMTVSASPG